MEIHAKREPIIDLLTVLNTKFSSNLNNLSTTVIELLESVDLRSRAIDGAANELLKNHTAGDKQKIECASIPNEIFADFSQAMYLLALGLVVPARMLVRRGLELGIGTVYMWDLPHEYWGWSKHDDDLSFSNMTDHLTSQKYLSHLSNIQNKTPPIWPCNAASLQKLYRTLSNTVHGKADGLPPLSPERYSAGSNNIEEHLNILIKIQNLLLMLWCARFVGLHEYLDTNYPHAVRNPI